MTKIRTIKRNGKTWKAPIKNGANRRERQLSRKEIQELTGVSEDMKASTDMIPCVERTFTV